MSLYLPEQKLGSHSTEGGSSNKFILKGRQTGSMHRGHTWVFRAESHDTMMAWYEDIKVLTERTPQERSEFVRGHVRSLSQSSHRSTSSDGVVDEDDDEPYSADTAVAASTSSRQDLRRPEAGGRFPSDIQVNAQRGLQAPLSPSSVSSGFDNFDRDAAIQSSALPDSMVGTFHRENIHPNGYGGTSRTPMDETPSNAAVISQQAREDGVNPYTSEPVRRSRSLNRQSNPISMQVTGMQRAQSQRAVPDRFDEGSRPASSIDSYGSLGTPGGNSQYGYWMSGNDKHASNPLSNDALHQDSGVRAPVGETLNHTILTPKAGMGSSGNAYGQGMSIETRKQNSSRDHQPHSAIRPTAGTVRNDSVPTISNLHIPGEYPKGGTPAFEARH